jgi:hypothetical protein
MMPGFRTGFAYPKQEGIIEINRQKLNSARIPSLDAIPE